jgi:hypothetical protein
MGSDVINASADVDHIRFTGIGDSPYDLPGPVFAHDLVNNFNADQDKFVFDHIPGTDPANAGWTLINFAGQDYILIDVDGGGMVNPSAPGGHSNYEMAIAVTNLTGTLDDSDFQWLVGP